MHPTGFDAKPRKVKQMDSTDAYIVSHARSMTQKEIARKLGVNKSTVSRRMAALRESGELDAKAAEAVRRDSQRAREKLHGCTMSRTDRLSYLMELRDMLHAELSLSGGQSLARVASEYRRTLEEIEALSDELGVAMDAARKFNPVMIERYIAGMMERYPTTDRTTVRQIVGDVLAYLESQGVIEC